MTIENRPAGNFSLALMAVLFAATATLFAAGSETPAPPQAAPAAFAITSPAFPDGGSIPEKCTCKGLNISPLLSWSHPPADTKSFALIVYDADAKPGHSVLWLLYGIPDETSGLPERMAHEMVFENGSAQGTNDFHNIGYNGPCPPKGQEHHYVFALYALDLEKEVKPGLDRAQLERSIQGHILAKTQLTGRYQLP